MSESSDKEQRKKKITEVKTFSVPFDLGEIKENISISTNKTRIPSKEEIIKKAFQFDAQGNILEATKYYQYFINQGFKVSFTRKHIRSYKILSIFYKSRF